MWGVARRAVPQPFQQLGVEWFTQLVWSRTGWDVLGNKQAAQSLAPQRLTSEQLLYHAGSMPEVMYPIPLYVKQVIITMVNISLIAIHRFPPYVSIEKQNHRTFGQGY